MKRLPPLFAPLLVLVMFVVTLALPPKARAQTTLLPDDARFVLVLNPSRVYQSTLGQMILDKIRDEEPNVDEMIDQLSESVGIDLRTSLGQTIFFGMGYDRRDFAMVADIGPTSGNLNGLMLTAPGYESSVYRETVIIHSLVSDGPEGSSDRLFCAMPKRPGTGSYYMVASFDPQRTRDMVDKTMDADARLTPTDANGDTLIEAWFNGLPELARAAEAEGPPSAVAELIQSGRLSLSESGDTATAQLRLTMQDGLRAQQVFELLRGGVAMMQLVATAEPEAAPLADIARMIDVQHNPGDTDVTATFSASYDKLKELMITLESMDHGHGPGPAHEHIDSTEANG